MPYSAKKSGKGYSIVNKNTGKVVGHSKTKSNAQKSINARNAGAHGWKGNKK
jgi:hypothetical protein